ncbi:succinate dehydrogenase, cytochrome b556 subunit [Kiloniella sp. b19]|uniref:succinate dehydrogenase, cytochrome b556 subunit n=1 Tax=Kiloniella sp. GXU_MW_B19 TaxID=3141326 RepID=UPI0031E382A6
MSRSQRPLSPHLQVYRPQITSALSILFRIAGVATSLGIFLMVWWLVAGATGAEYYNTFSEILGSAIGRLVLFGWTLALVYHLCNGVRHLFWDAGKGLALESIQPTAIMVIVSSVALTLGLWILAYSTGGL